MIVEDQLDRCMGRIDGVEKLKEFDKLAAAVAVLDEGMNLAGQQIDAGQQADGGMAFVLVVARENCMPAGLGRQVRGRVGGSPGCLRRPPPHERAPTRIRLWGINAPEGTQLCRTDEVLNCFQKKTQKTRKVDLKLGRAALPEFVKGAGSMSKKRFANVWDVIEDAPAQAENMKLRFRVDDGSEGSCRPDKPEPIGGGQAAWCYPATHL